MHLEGIKKFGISKYISGVNHELFYENLVPKAVCIFNHFSIPYSFRDFNV